MAELAWGPRAADVVRGHGRGVGAAGDHLPRRAGATHDHVASIAALDRPCGQYDQVGNGRSSRGLDVGEDFWTVDLFLRELDALVGEFGLDAYHVIGQSWGGMLAIVEEPERFLAVVGAFLDEADSLLEADP